MSSKERVLKKLLIELDDLCRRHNIKYSLAGPHVEYVAEYGELPPGFSDITVAMAIGDIERLMRIVNVSEDRRIECFANNYNARDFGIRYYDISTTCINIFDYRKHTYQGIFLRILEIERNPKKSQRKKLSLLKKVCKGTNINNYSIKNIKNIVLSLFIKLVKAIVGKKKFHEKAFVLKKQYNGFDSWEQVNQLKDVESIYLDGRPVMASRNMVHAKVQKDKTPRYVEKYEIIYEDRRFANVMDDDTVKSLKNISQNIDKFYAIEWDNEKNQKEIAAAWNTYLMSRDVVSCRRKYDAEKISEINDLIVSDKYEEAREELDLYCEMIKTWENKKIKFLRSEELDIIVDKIANVARGE